jgi:hypothetical protein
MASAARGYPAVGNKGFPGNLGYNKQLKTLIDEGATVYGCRFAMGALYGMREDDLLTSSPRLKAGGFQPH